jgi:hypothetical protein
MIQNITDTEREIAAEHSRDLAAYELTVSNLTAERDALAERVKALEADAGRYRWLRDIENQVGEDDISVMDPYLNTYFGDELDAAIDAAKGATT